MQNERNNFIEVARTRTRSREKKAERSSIFSKNSRLRIQQRATARLRVTVITRLTEGALSASSRIDIPSGFAHVLIAASP